MKKKKKEKKKKQEKNWLEYEIFKIMEKSLEEAMKVAVKDIFKD